MKISLTNFNISWFNVPWIVYDIIINVKCNWLVFYLSGPWSSVDPMYLWSCTAWSWLGTIVNLWKLLIKCKTFNLIKLLKKNNWRGKWAEDVYTLRARFAPSHDYVSPRWCSERLYQKKFLNFWSISTSNITYA